MKDDGYLSQQLNRPRVPKDMESKIRDNWREQTANRRHNLAAKYLIIAAGIFGSVVSTVLVKHVVRSSDLVQVAIEDINNDTIKHVGIMFPIETLIKRANIKLPPSSMPIEMVKRCNLNGNETLHIKVAGANHGAVHLFIKKGDFTHSITNTEQGTEAIRPWGLIKPRSDLSVLVLYTNDMNIANVDKLIETMFFV